MCEKEGTTHGEKTVDGSFSVDTANTKKTENPLLSKPESVLPAKQAEEGEKTK